MRIEYESALEEVKCCCSDVLQVSGVRKIKEIAPQIAPDSLTSLLDDSFRRGEGMLILHIGSLLLKAENIGSQKGVTREELLIAKTAILYHDLAKLSLERFVSPDLSRILDSRSFGHSLAIRRLFLFLDMPEIAQTVRHNSTDFVADVRKKRVTVPQFLLNIVDRIDDSGISVSPEEKAANVRRKIGLNRGFDEGSEELACLIIREAIGNSKPLRDFSFVCKEKLPLYSVVFSQRFDGKYCPPIGKYRDTSSNFSIANYLAKWGWESTILHEGDFPVAEYNNGMTRVVGVNQLIISEDAVYEEIVGQMTGKDLVIIEGWTTALINIRFLLSNEVPLVLLLRTMSMGSLEKERLMRLSSADEVWVVSEQMRDILEGQLLASKVSSVNIRVLRVGFDEECFFVDNNAVRQKNKIVYVGALSVLKGVDVLIESFQSIRKKIPTAELHIIGSPEIYGTANKFDDSVLGSIPGIVYHGFLESRAIARHLQTAHIVVLLTRIYETWGKAIMQARCCGTRVVVSNSGALPYHVQSGKEGIVVDVVSKEMVAEALSFILSDSPITTPPLPGMYCPWKLIAVDFVTYYDLLLRRKIKGYN